jgi:hypothetical protein
MTYDKNYSGTAGSTGTTAGSTGGTGAGYGRSGSFGGGQGSGYGSSQSFGSSQGYGSQGYGSPYSAGYENWSGNWSGSGGGGNKMLLGLLVGAAAGAAIALLMAPTTGREARQNLGRWARDTRHKATEVAGNLRNRFGSQQEGFGSATPQSGTGMSGTPLNEDRNIPEL